MAEWRSRYKGFGVMVYWHVETNAVSIYSQTKSFSSSEIAAMIEGLVRHDTEMRVEKNFVDSHGQSEVAFAFCHLLGSVRLMPRLKRIKYERLYLPEKGTAGDYGGFCISPRKGSIQDSSRLEDDPLPLLSVLIDSMHVDEVQIDGDGIEAVVTGNMENPGKRLIVLEGGEVEAL